ncbi:MAG: M43 family zinc metalloprotease [Bacteroidota bacterium]|nr:M43 family zinc metalloprotease [Bacteroidota bacterium]
MKNRILLLIFGGLLTANLSFSQKCGTYPGSLEEDIKKYPHFYQSLESKNAELKLQHEKVSASLKNSKLEDGIRIIPVVVHVIHDMGNENISDASIQGAIDILNANINGQSANFLSKTPDVFAAVRGDAKIEFRLAKLDPDRNPTTGINRVRSSLTDEPEPRNAVKALSYWNSFEYFNIWTVKRFAPQDDGNTLLGYAQFPNSGSMSTDGVVLLASQMVSGGTLTHEVGHWLGLRHTWGDSDCGDDGVKDTPPAKGPNFGVNLSDFPYHVGNIGIDAGCLGDSMNWAGEMFVNYMDYSNDADVTMFTVDQNGIMNETLDGIYDEESGITGIGFREYMWSPGNLDSTGTADGYQVPTCTQEASFVVMNGASSICEGEALLLKGNLPMFGTGNVNSFVWDFGDGDTDDSQNNFLSHIYNSTGSFDVTLTVDYDEVTESRSSRLEDLDISNASSYDSIVTTLIVQGTEQELIDLGASNIIEITLDSLGLYWGTNDSSYFRGDLEKVTYVAYYENTCVSSVTKENFVTVNNTTASSSASSYSYSFEEASELNEDWRLTPSTNIESQWSFNTGGSTSWKWEDGIAVDGSASIKVDREDMLIGVSTEIISKAYDLSAFASPAIKFFWSGASVNTFPVNVLAVSYSKNCGEDWSSLGILDAVETSNAGLYTTNFKPDTSEWNHIIMSSSQLINSNVRFKFEYIVNGSSNNFYLDHIQIGEEASLMMSESVNKSKLSIFPNPAKDKATIVLNNIAEKNVDIVLINILGAEVGKLFSGKIVSNYQEISTDLIGIGKGIYFVKVINNGDVIMSDKVIIE